MRLSLLTAAFLASAPAWGQVAPGVETATAASQMGSSSSTPAQPSAQNVTANPDTAPPIHPQATESVPVTNSQPADATAEATVYLPTMRRRQGSRVVAYRGGPIPLGMHVETRRSRGLIALGGVLFGLTYVGSAAFSAASQWVCSGSSLCVNGFGWLVIPIAGPFVSSGLAQDGGVRASLIIDGVVQAAGFGVLLASVLTPRQVLVDDPYVATGEHGFAWRVMPGGLGTPAGLTLDARF
jgi:hypothetical protein